MELNALLELGIRALPPDQRLALVLCDVHGYAYEEISDITGQAMGTVKSRINRGRIELATQLKRLQDKQPALRRRRGSSARARRGRPGVSE